LKIEKYGDLINQLVVKFYNSGTTNSLMFNMNNAYKKHLNHRCNNKTYF
jgi:hypothetical protein